MKVVRLELFAFGPFTNGRLDFSKKPGALQLIYGPNEAGKSTTLRALLALLYGIPLRTSDAHVHDMTRLRIGATLEDARGKSLSIVRRKGAKHTLLDAQGQPLNEAVLSELMLGIDETMFRNMFGLDHQRLREGAEALLAAGGSLGEGLFDASVGTRSLGDVKEALRLEADELYKLRGKTPKLNQALDALRDKLRLKRDAALSPTAYVEQTKALGLAKQQRELALAQRRALLTEKSSLTRKLSLLPLLARHAAACEELRSLAEQPAPGTAPATGPELPEELLRDLERRYGVMLSAEADLPQLLAELSALSRELSAVRARLGRAAEVGTTIDTPLRTRLRRAAEEQTARARRLGELRDVRTGLVEELRALEQRSAEAPQASELSALAALVEGIEREDVVATRSRAERELLHRAASVARAAAQLGLRARAKEPEPAFFERLAELGLPEESELSELERREQELERSAVRLRDQQTQTEKRQRQLALARAELLSAGELSTLDQLASARAHRDATFEDLTHAFEPTRAVTYRAQRTAADELADKLRREAARSTELARVNAEQALLDEEHKAQAAGLGELAAQRTALDGHTQRLLAGTGLDHDGVRSLRSKLLKLHSLRDAASELIGHEATQRSLLARSAALAQSLHRQLADPREPSSPGSLDDLLAAARGRLLAARAEAQELAALRARSLDLSARLATTDRQLAGLLEQQESALESSRAQLSACGFQDTLSYDEVLACLDDVTLLQNARRRSEALEARIAASEQHSALLRDDVKRAATRLSSLARGTARFDLPSAAELPLAEQLQALSRWERAQRESARDGARLKQEVETFESELFALGDGAALPVLRASVAQLDADAARARLFEIEASASTLEEEIGALDQEIGRLQAGLTHLTEAPFAVPVAEEVEAELGNVRALLRRYIEVKLSLTLLSREVERHRQKHQGPLLSRASALFSTLTLGRYTGLSVELSERDEPLLCAVQQAGKVVRVPGLSDGTRDQLYLALRIASIERFLETSPALPLVLDDAFIHFDDARAEAALSVLGALSARTQVLFFTHHARMVELAKRVLKPGQLALHELDPVRGTVAFRDNGPLFADA